VGLAALALEKIHALVPSLFTLALGAINRLLPPASGASLPAVRGKTLDAAQHGQRQ
jgi:hypothetical protein